MLQTFSEHTSLRLIFKIKVGMLKQVSQIYHVVLLKLIP